MTFLKSPDSLTHPAFWEEEVCFCCALW